MAYNRPMKNTRFWKLLSALELALAIAAVVLDLFIPTIVLLGLLFLSLLARREKLSVLGFKKPASFPAMLLFITAAVIAWSLLQLGLLMPVLNHLTGTTQDVSAYANLQGNLGSLLFFLLMTWTLAAFGEEIAYRGYIPRRIQDLAGENRAGAIVAIGLSSLLFGLAHTEQGVVGVIVTALDAVFFSLLKQRYGGNLWAPILAHGISNTIGLVTFYLVGPLTGFW